MKKVSGPKVVTAVEALESPLPAEIQEALGELVGAAREGLLALSVGLGLGVVHELMELEVTEVVGPKGKHDADRTAKRHGHERGSMTLGGRRAEVRRPRMRTADDEHELPVQSYEYFADRDPLTRAVMDRLLAGVSTRRFASVGEPVGEEVEQDASSTSKSTVSELFIERTRTALSELMGRRLDDVRLAVMMLDGLEIADRTHVVALGISTEGVKIPLGLWEGSTENAALARAAGRPGRPRPGSRAGDPVRHRRGQGVAPRDQGRVRRARVGARRDARDPDADAARDRRPARQDPVLNESMRVDDRDRPLHAAQREALAGRRHAQALDRRRHARRRAAVPTDHRLPRPRQARDRDRTPRSSLCSPSPTSVTHTPATREDALTVTV